MTTLSKEEVDLAAEKFDYSEFSSEFRISADGLHAFADHIATLARADLVAENERLHNDLLDTLDCKQGKGPTALATVIAERDELRAENERLKEMAMFFSTYTDPDELEMDEIENAARESFRRANSGVKGATITRANSYESHVIWATKARISKEITPTRTALAAAEAREEKLRAAIDVVLSDAEECKDHEGWLANLVSCEAIHQLDEALDQPRDDSALREMIAGVYEECAKWYANGGYLLDESDVHAAIRALAEKARHGN